MPDLAEIAHALTDAAIALLAGSFPFVAGGAAALAAAVVAGLGWLCYEELRGRATAPASRTSGAGRGFAFRLAGRKGPLRQAIKACPTSFRLTSI
jgi:hypothetical protein